jgi:hypothetical protein
MKRIVFVIGFVGLCFLGQSQDFIFNYSAASIADSLKKNAHTVMRLDEATLEILSPSKYVFKVHEVMTILNEEGAYHLHQRLSYDKFYSVENVSIKVYNALGLLSNKYSKKDFSVRSAYDGISLATDDKIMELSLMGHSYPFTIDVQYEIKASSYIDFPDWVLNRQNTSTEVFRYIVTVPSSLDVRHRFVNLDSLPSVQTVKDKKIYTWEVKNVTSKKLPAGGYQPSYYFPRVEVAPTRFDYDGYDGSFSSWQEYGRWNYSLYEAKNNFSESRRKEILSLVASYTDTKDKIRILYDYLKTNMRYVSIQFGIGGYKPFPSKYVDEKKYGDCKALTNYMRCLLDVAGIQSYPALINAGSNANPVDASFPRNRFNHVILCVPNNADTVWLECTSNDSEAGFLGSFTENRNALLLTENGGSIVRTPVSKKENNLLFSTTEIFLNADGGAKAFTKVYSTGDIAQEFGQLKRLEADDQKEVFVNYLHYKPGDVFSLAYFKDSAKGHLFQLNYEFDKLFAFKAGNKFFFPQKLNKIFYEGLKNEEREIDYLFDYPYEKRDTTIFYLPQGFELEEAPANKELSSEFGSYKKELILQPSSGKLTIVTTLSLKQHMIPAKKYKEILNLFSAVNENEEQNIVLKKL